MSSVCTPPCNRNEQTQFRRFGAPQPKDVAVPLTSVGNGIPLISSWLSRPVVTGSRHCPVLAARFKFMPAPFSSDLRLRVIWLTFLQVLSHKAISRLLYISPRTVQRHIARYLTSGAIRSRKQRHGPQQELSCFERIWLLRRITARPSSYLKELSKDLENVTGAVVSQATICRALKLLNVSRKMLRRIARHRSEEERQRFAASTMFCPFYATDMFIFVDESGFDRRSAMPRYGYAVRGKTPVDRTFLMRGRRVKDIAAISSNGVLDAAMYEHNVNGDCFMDFLRKSLLPIPQPFNGVNPHSIVIMDNASIHHVAAVANLVRGVGAILKFFATV